MKKITLLVLAPVALEFFLRIFWLPPYLDKRYRRNDYKWVSQNVVLNRFGYRDREFELVKSRDVFRVYAVGDSYTYGWYINDYLKSYPKFLEKDLAAKFADKKIEVINAAKPGLNLEAEIERVENQGFLFAPDIITIGINAQDLVAKEFPPRFSGNSFVRSLRLYQATLGNLERRKVSKKTFEEIEKSYSEGSEQLSRYKKSLGDLKLATDGIGAKIYLIVFPQYIASSPDSEYKFDFYHTAVKNLGEDLGIETIDLKNVFDKESEKKRLVLNPNDPHPSEYANKIAADYIFEKITFSPKPSHPRLVSERINQGKTLNGFLGVVTFDTPGWVYFDRKWGLDTMQIFLPLSTDTKIPFLENVLKTAKSKTHEGWFGAKLEYNIFPKDRIVSLGKTLYGYEIIGVSQLRIFWREDGNQKSKDLDLTTVKITKGTDGWKIESSDLQNIDFARLTLDLEANQFEIEDDRIVSVSSSSPLGITYISKK